MSRAPPSVAAPPPEVDAKLMGLGINIDQRKRLMIAARLGIGPVGSGIPGLPGPKAREQAPEPQSRSRSPPGPAGSTGYSAAQAAAQDRERRRRELERKKEDDDEMDLQAFMGGCQKASQKAQIEKEKQRKLAEQKTREEAMQVEARRRREAEAAAHAAKARAAQKASGPSEEKILAMLRQIAAAKAPALSSEACACGTPFVEGAKFCSECGAKRPAPAPQDNSHSSTPRQFREEAPPPPPEEKRRETSEEARRREERRRLRREEKKRKREEKARLRELAGGEYQEEEDDEAGSSDVDESDRIAAKEGLISAKNMDDSMRRHWGESVKGRVSNLNKGFTDADLERRFLGGLNGSSGEKLMSEEEVLSMLRKSKGRR